ncbi:MAG: hypothetical protein FVQ79_08740 [Planctomycetes bacterium]|nr:hypothetical protein [Planctomycetota bacterium]
MFKMPGTAKFGLGKLGRLLSAILWGLIATAGTLKAASVDIVADPNDPNVISKADVLLYFGHHLAEIAAGIGLGDEFETIARAAIRNKCFGDNFYILLAIRKAKDGRAGREFGILHWKCLREMRKRPGETLDIQAGWAAATIVKNRARWQRKGEPGGFIGFLADRYCPKKTDPAGNANWRVNVTYFTAKIRGLKFNKQ